MVVHDQPISAFLLPNNGPAAIEIANLAGLVGHDRLDGGGAPSEVAGVVHDSIVVGGELDGFQRASGIPVEQKRITYDKG